MVSKKVPVRIESRTISGRGLIKIPPSKNIRILYIYFQVVRLPRLNFTSSKFNPDRSEYAKITWLRNDFILKEQALNFEMELKTWEQDSVGYLAYANVCMYNSLIAYFEYVCSPLALIPLPRKPDLYVEPLQNLPDTVKIVCRDDAAIVADMWKYEYDIACTEADTESPPPPDPPKIAKVPPGVPIGDISPPYDSPDDNGDTVPNPDDEVAPPPDPGLGEPCALIVVNFQYTQFDGMTVVTSVTIYAPYYSIRVRSIGTVGIDYVEDIAVMCAIQQPDMCNNGERQEVPAGYTATAPLSESVEFLGISAP